MMTATILRLVYMLICTWRREHTQNTYICMSRYIYMYIHMHTCTCIYTYIGEERERECTYVCRFQTSEPHSLKPPRMYTCRYFRIFKYKYEIYKACMCVFMCMHLYVCICIHIHVELTRAYIVVYIYMYIYIYIHRFSICIIQRNRWHDHAVSLARQVIRTGCTRSFVMHWHT